jgi:hypothetical protein
MGSACGSPSTDLSYARTVAGLDLPFRQITLTHNPAPPLGVGQISVNRDMALNFSLNRLGQKLLRLGPKPEIAAPGPEECPSENHRKMNLDGVIQQLYRLS